MILVAHVRDGREDLAHVRCAAVRAPEDAGISKSRSWSPEKPAENGSWWWSGMVAASRAVDDGAETFPSTTMPGRGGPHHPRSDGAAQPGRATPVS